MHSFKITETTSIEKTSTFGSESLSNISEIEGKKVELIYDTIQGKILKGRYRVDRYLDNGNNGWIFTATDIGVTDDKKSKVPLVIKIQKYDKIF